MTGMRSALIKVTTFAAVTLLFIGMAYIAYGRVRFESSSEYTAMFREVSGLQAGNEVRVAGVTIGEVSSVELDPDNQARVEFSIQKKTPLMVGSRGIIRYKNVVGQRYLELTEGAGPPQQLPENGVIPASQTSPALDLDELYNGFAPLFEGLQPAQINDLTGSLIQVLQGQGGSIEQLLGQIGSLTSSLADRDAVIGSLVTNLNTLLGTVNQRGPQVSNLVIQLQQLVSGLARDRGPLGDSLVRIDRFTGTVAGFLDEARPDLRGNIAEITRLSRLINADAPKLNTLLQKAPGYYQLLGRVGAYQSAFQFYLCGAQIRVGTPGGGPPIMSDMIASQEARCRF